MTMGKASPLLAARKDCYHRAINTHQTTYADILRADVANGKKTLCEAVRWLRNNSGDLYGNTGMSNATATMLIINGVV